jgi:hypothetical protein
MQYDHNPMSLNELYTAIEPWASEAGCGHFCDILSVEVSSRFLKVKFRCPTCGNEAIAHWDLAKHDWVETMDLNENTDSVGEFVGSFNYEAGPFDVKRFGRRIGLDDIEEIITTASNYPDLTDHQLDTCLKMLFERTYQVFFLRQF